MDDCEYTDIDCTDARFPLSVIQASSYVRLEDGDNGELRFAQRAVIVCAET